MKNLIERVAYFSLCAECECHGHIVCASGKESNEFVSVSSGLVELKALVRSGEIAEDEALEVRRQIQRSGFEIEDPIMDDRLRRSARARKEFRDVIEEFHQGLLGIQTQPGQWTERNHQRYLH